MCSFPWSSLPTFRQLNRRRTRGVGRRKSSGPQRATTRPRLSAYQTQRKIPRSKGNSLLGGWASQAAPGCRRTSMVLTPGACGSYKNRISKVHGGAAKCDSQSLSSVILPAMGGPNSSSRRRFSRSRCPSSRVAWRRFQTLALELDFSACKMHQPTALSFPQEKRAGRASGSFCAVSAALLGNQRANGTQSPSEKDAQN